MRRAPIKEHITTCVHCGHHHDPQPIIEQFKAHGKSSMSLYCESCKKYNRVRQTKTGLISLNGRLSRETGKSTTIREHRMGCAHCDHPLDKQDFQFLLKKRNSRRTTCRKCFGALVVRRTALGFYTTGKADYKRLSDNTEKGVNRLEFDPTAKRFRLLKHRYPLKPKEQCQK